MGEGCQTEGQVEPEVVVKGLLPLVERRRSNARGGGDGWNQVAGVVQKKVLRRAARKRSFESSTDAFSVSSSPLFATHPTRRFNNRP